MDDKRRPVGAQQETKAPPTPHPDRPLPEFPERLETEMDEPDDEVVPEGRFEPL